MAEALRAAGFDIARESIVEGLTRASWPGRLESIPGAPAFLLDGAHNAAGAAALRAYLDEFQSAPLTLVFGAMNDKEIEPMLADLATVARAVVLTRPRSPRSLAPSVLAAALPPGVDPVLTESVEEALARAVEITPRDGTVCVAGSLYLVGEAKALLAKGRPS
jgi:dihydrofolate synthase/folylpolyglutamate synthase